MFRSFSQSWAVFSALLDGTSVCAPLFLVNKELCSFTVARNPTHSTSESSVPKIPNSEPWHTGSHAKYQYHPEGDQSRGKKDAPSALNVVIIPNVNLPKVCPCIVSKDASKISDRRDQRDSRIEVITLLVDV
jgi:hypothetical protein